MTVDLIANVMAAAHPNDVSAAAQRLKNMAPAGSDRSFTQVLTRTPSGSKPSERTHDAEPKAAVTQDVTAKLEGVFLSSALESVFPKSGSSLFGDAESGRFWRGLQIEAMAGAISGRKTILNQPLPDRSAVDSSTIRAFAFGGDNQT
jgi:hypothetical protein